MKHKRDIDRNGIGDETFQRTYLVLDLSVDSWKVHLLLKHSALLFQLNRLSPVVEGAGYENLVCLARPAETVSDYILDRLNCWR